MITKKYADLRAKMSPESRSRAQAKTERFLKKMVSGSKKAKKCGNEGQGLILHIYGIAIPKLPSCFA